MDKEKVIELDKNIYVLKPFKDEIDDKIRYGVLPKVDPFNSSCIWDNPIKGKEAINLKEVGQFYAMHRCGHYALFKPSIAEVLEYAPKYLLGKFNAITIELERYDDDIAKHISLVKLYIADIIESNKDENISKDTNVKLFDNAKFRDTFIARNGDLVCYHKSFQSKYYLKGEVHTRTLHTVISKDHIWAVDDDGIREDPKSMGDMFDIVSKENT